MKKIFVFIILFSGLIACQDDQNSSTENTQNQTELNDESSENEGSSNIDQTEAAKITILQPGPEISEELKKNFVKRVSIFGLNLIATESVNERKLLHAANILAQYLDNNEDSEVDDPGLLENMIRENATLVMFKSQEEAEQVFESLDREKVGKVEVQDLYDDETFPEGASNLKFDASLEEVLHLVTFTGYFKSYPNELGPQNSSLTDAMDKARGGKFETVPPSYPETAWYTYDDETCNYNCMVVEYFYWALTSILGAQDFDGRYDYIRNEWKLNTLDKVKNGDPDVFKLLNNPKYKLPKVLPTGRHKDLENLTVEKL